MRNIAYLTVAICLLIIMMYNTATSQDTRRTFLVDMPGMSPGPILENLHLFSKE